MLNYEREKKYGEVLGLMLKDAQEAKNETSDNLVTAREQEKIAETELKRLNNTVDKNYRGFLSVIKALLKMLYKKPEDPFELERALDPANTYLRALKDIPRAEENLIYAQNAHAKAQKEYNDAENTLKLIEKLREKYPHEDEDE